MFDHFIGEIPTCLLLFSVPRIILYGFMHSAILNKRHTHYSSININCSIPDSGHNFPYNPQCSKHSDSGIEKEKLAN